MNRGLAIIALLLLAPTPGLATTEPEQPAAKPAKPRKICRSQTPTGRLISASVCHTQEEWDAVDAANEAAARAVIEQATRQSGNPGATPSPFPTR